MDINIIKCTHYKIKSKVRIKAQRQKLNCHFKKYSIRTATITVTIKIKPKKYQEYATALYKFSTYLLPQ